MAQACVIITGIPAADPGRRSTFLIRALVVLGFATLVAAGPIDKLDSSWKTYRNKQLNYCMSYPSRWVRGEAFDGAGIYFEVGARRSSLPIAEINFAQLEDNSSEAAEYVQLHLDNLRKFQRVESLELIENRSIQLVDGNGLLTKNRYRDPLDGKDWVDEMAVALRGNVLYRFQLECRAKDITRFEPVFTRVVGSLRVGCNR